MRGQQATSNVTEDYVKVIYLAGEFGGTKLTVSSLAQRLGVVVSTASENVKKLAEEGLVINRPYRGLALTTRGEELALQMVRRHRLIETFLVQRLGYSWDQVHAEAEILEHAASDQLITAIDKELGYPEHDPHGDPIPTATGKTRGGTLKPLLDAPTGTKHRVARVSDADSEVLRYLSDLGIGVGKQLTIITKTPALGMATIALDGKTQQVSLPALAALWINREEN